MHELNLTLTSCASVCLKIWPNYTRMEYCAPKQKVKIDTLTEKALPKCKSYCCNLTQVVLKSVAQVKTHISISNYVYV